MPHGHCWLWTPAMVWTQATTNLLIALSYIAISSTLAYLVYRVRDLPFKAMYLAFGVFIVTCGITHLLDVLVIWRPLLDYAKTESGRFIAAVEDVDPRRLVREAVEDLRPQATDKGLALHVHDRLAPDVVRTDARALRLVVVNLVDNAVKFSEHGQIDVELAGAEDVFTITVRDTGPGIKPADRSRIFQPFGAARFDDARHGRLRGEGEDGRRPGARVDPGRVHERAQRRAGGSARRRRRRALAEAVRHRRAHRHARGGDHSEAKWSVASMSPSTMPSSLEACPASAMIFSSACGIACFRSQALRAGQTTS
jgi:hypothetical protein